MRRKFFYGTDCALRLPEHGPELCHTIFRLHAGRQASQHDEEFCGLFEFLSAYRQRILPLGGNRTRPRWRTAYAPSPPRARRRRLGPGMLGHSTSVREALCECGRRGYLMAMLLGRPCWTSNSAGAAPRFHAPPSLSPLRLMTKRQSRFFATRARTSAGILAISSTSSIRKRSS